MPRKTFLVIVILTTIWAMIGMKETSDKENGKLWFFKIISPIWIRFLLKIT